MEREIEIDYAVLRKLQEGLSERMTSDQNIVILTGAGISADSGLATFRGADGLWCGHRVEDVATPEAFMRNPVLVQDFYNQRRRQLREVVPNAAHHALAKLGAEWQGEVLLVTQNVDDLHDRACAEVTRSKGFELIHMHGELTKARCLDTQEVVEWHEDIFDDTCSPISGNKGRLRPHIVWFGEMPLAMERIQQALSRCDLFLSIGTSGRVYPAAGFVELASHAGAHTVELNLERSDGYSAFTEARYGKAAETVPAYVAELLQK
jgi:NAD-dependent deacetylase